MGVGTPIALRSPIQASVPLGSTAIAVTVMKDSGRCSGVVAGAVAIVAPVRRSIRATIELKVSTPISTLSMAA